jgi:1-phosphofructokinase family hexose kinase
LIYTITPNPALDLNGIVNELVTDEKNYVRTETRFPGGNAVNVARLLTRLQVPVIASGFLGRSVGQEIRHLLDVEHVRHDFVPIDGTTRISVTMTSAKTSKQTRLSFPGPSIQRAEILKLFERVSAYRRVTILVLGGSFPPGFNVSDANRIVRVAQERQMLVVVDAPSQIMRKLNLNGLTIIKPNLHEFQELIGRKLTSLSSIAKAAKVLARKVGLVCVSSVEGGALIASRDFVCHGKTPSIKPKTTVGAGDSMVAAIVAEHWRRETTEFNDPLLLQELLRQGLAAASAALIRPGTELGKTKDIRKFYKEISVSELRL